MSLSLGFQRKMWTGLVSPHWHSSVCCACCMSPLLVGMEQWGECGVVRCCGCEESHLPGGCQGTHFLHKYLDVWLSGMLLFPWAVVLQTDFILLGILKRHEVEAMELQELPLDLCSCSCCLFQHLCLSGLDLKKIPLSFSSSMPTVFLANDSSTASRTSSSSWEAFISSYVSGYKAKSQLTTVPTKVSRTGAFLSSHTRRGTCQGGGAGPCAGGTM